MTWVLGDEVMPEGFSARQDGSIPGDAMTYAGMIRQMKKALKMVSSVGDVFCREGTFWRITRSWSNGIQDLEECADGETPFRPNLREQDYICDACAGYCEKVGAHPTCRDCDYRDGPTWPEQQVAPNPCQPCKSCCDHLGSDPDCCNCNTFTYATRQSAEDELWRQTLQDNDDFWRKQLDLKDAVIASLKADLAEAGKDPGFWLRYSNVLDTKLTRFEGLVSNAESDRDYWLYQYECVSKQLVDCQAELSKSKDEGFAAKNYGENTLYLESEVKRLEAQKAELIKSNAELVDRRLAAEERAKAALDAKDYWLAAYQSAFNDLRDAKDENQKLREAYNELVLKRKVNQERYQNGQPCILAGHVCGFVTELQERNDNQARAIQELTDALPEFQYDETAGTFPADAILTTDGYETLKPACQSCLKGDEPTCGCGLFDKKPALKPIPDTCVSTSGVHCETCIWEGTPCHRCGQQFTKDVYDVEGYGFPE